MNGTKAPGDVDLDAQHDQTDTKWLWPCCNVLAESGTECPECGNQEPMAAKMVNTERKR